MRAQRFIASLLCGVALISAPVAVAADSDVSSSSSSTGSVTADYEGTPALDKARLAMTYGVTEEGAAKDCAARLHKGEPGQMRPLMYVPEDCSWMPITEDDVRDAWAGSAETPAVTAKALLRRIFVTVLKIADFANYIFFEPLQAILGGIFD
ncbi:hypothetical protein C1Y63_11485 [Corynebacterium sp. 13CS0277]|uniref:hypothetical protein n=1 Tax=Corynebacterium sp. 13CS0277 TaxID=2071994 RepID=UPI000D0423A0|nr:hypothetical protein [Corynebacterium sp. 13CS0277]PRQ10418.1 hypothetical protein C1Y63_11485 [Corynebacterium sp. 13CS0277]